MGEEGVQDLSSLGTSKCLQQKRAWGRVAAAGVC